MPQGRFITFEGVEGSGKTTQIEMLVVALRARGCDVLTTREPGGTVLGERLRELLLHPDSDPVPLAELFMLEAARAQLTERVILPAIAAGRFVVADRYADSSLAYQAAARGIEWESVERLNRAACSDLVPDRTLVLDLPVETALGRARTRTTTNAGNRRFEDEALAFHGTVAAAYRRLARAEPGRVRIVPASGPPEDVHARVVAELLDLLP